MDRDTHQLVAWLEAHWDDLTHLERRLVVLSYGMRGEEVHSIAQIEIELMISEDQIRALERNILKKLRNTGSV